MGDETERTKQFYAGAVDYEWERLVQHPFGRLEFDTTMHFLRAHLPKHGHVLDAGGGPGRYAVALAKMGLDVTLLDLVAEHVQRARQEVERAGVTDRIREITEGTITDLSGYETGSFDAVICLGGPLSHVYPEAARQAAIDELLRVAKPGAPVFVSVMSKWGVLLATPAGWPHIVARKEVFDPVLETGDDFYWQGDGYSHFFTAQELEAAFLRQDVDVVAMVGLEGLNPNVEITNAFAENHPEAWARWRDAHFRICTEPFVVDASGHMMIVVRKKT